ncbi:MAG: hypothetical protein EA361_03680 [Bacteroidetes bacterium]|nr:MAG: hypothetical protein EA361_03680 [Bacteroidota bacterium]
MIEIVRTDLKNIIRDPSLVLICFVPFIMLALLYFGYPPLLSAWPEAAQYSGLGLAMFCITGSVMPGIAIAFAMLDEKDQHLQQVLQILPVSFRHITLLRLTITFLFGFVSALLMLTFSGIISYTITQTLLLAMLTAAIAPLMAIIPAFYASNKIEGATLSKLLNFLIMIPIPAFLFPGTWSWFMMIFPSWWIYFAFESVENPVRLVGAVAGGLIYLSVIMIVINKIIWPRK